MIRDVLHLGLLLVLLCAMIAAMIWLVVTAPIQVAILGVIMLIASVVLGE